MNIIALIGQIIGLGAMAILCLSYQTGDRKKLLIMQTVGTGLFCVHYLLIGAVSALWLNVVCFCRNIVYYFKDRHPLIEKGAPVLFAVIMAVMGVFSWENLFSLFIVVGLVINTLCLSFTDPQRIRYSLLVSSPLVLIYDFTALTWGGIINETLAVISALIGIIRFHKAKIDE